MRYKTAGNKQHPWQLCPKGLIRALPLKATSVIKHIPKSKLKLGSRHGPLDPYRQATMVGRQLVSPHWGFDLTSPLFVPMRLATLETSDLSKTRSGSQSSPGIPVVERFSCCGAW